MSTAATPSKAIAQALDNATLVTPAKPAKLQLVDANVPKAAAKDVKADKPAVVVRADGPHGAYVHRPIAAAADTRSGEKTRNLVRKYVGDLSITSDAQEPLLQESKNRFVLFPIKYHEIWQARRPRSRLG